VPKHVPAVDRAIRILRLMGNEPKRQFTLSELAEAADINLSTCHAILSCLADERMVVRRDPKRTYTLGPLIAELAAAAASQHLGLADAREAIVRLTEECHLACVIGARMGDEIVVLGHTMVDGRAPATPEGFHAPMVPPSGAVFMAWAPTDEVDAWLDGLGDAAADSDRAHHLRILDDIRRRGYLISLNATLSEVTLRYAARLASAGSSRARQQLVTELGEVLLSQEYALIGYPRSDFIAAPVFGPDGNVVLTITIESSDGSMPTGDLDHIIASLLDACAEVSTRVGGAYPEVPVA
jgi:DNA-binding IclR family transcriptional regulator